MTDTTAIEAQSTSNDEAAKDSKLQLRPPTLDLPAMPDAVEVVETISMAGIRPIGASHLVLAGSFANGRPIAASNLKVVEMLPGGRPIFGNDFTVMDTGMLPGGRPIMASDPHLLESSYLPGGRPIASNEIDNPESLMGFLD